MSDREKLIEILSVPIYPHLDADPVEVVADYLIDNGVTVQKWVPVSERLPTKEDAKVMRGYIIAITLNGEANIWRWTEVAKHPEWFTHWMPLPEPPKECE